MKPHGFTLVEMSIVLVIIALILGVVTVNGMSLIGSANAKAVVQMVEDLKRGALLFRQRYGYLPGDWPYTANEITGITSGHGNGDGSIGGSLDSTGNAAANSEAAEAPLQLFQTGIAGSLRNGRFGTDAGPVNLVSATTADGLVTGFAAQNPSSRNAIVFYGLSCVVAQEADSKLDDGNLASGRAMGAACANNVVQWFAVAL